MTWYAAYTKRYEFIGMLYINDRSQEAQDLRDRKLTTLRGYEKIRLGCIISKDIKMNNISYVSHVHIKLEEVARPYSRKTLFHYVIVENPEEMNPELDWHGATFILIGAPLMCDYCPDRPK